MKPVKTCPICRQPPNDPHRTSNGTVYCGACITAYWQSRALKQKEAPRSRSIERLRAQWRAANKRARQKNPEKHRSRNAAYRKTHPPKPSAATRRHSADRAAWLRAGDVTRAQLSEIYERDGRACRYCRAPVKATLKAANARGFDHVVSRANGGRHTASNIVVCCRGCNTRKGTRSVLEFTPASPIAA